MRVSLLREIPEEHGLRQQWNELVQEMERPEIFYTQQWALSMARAHRSSLTPLLALAWEGKTLVGVTALATDCSESTVFFLSGATADYCDFLSHPDRRDEYVDAVLLELRQLKPRKIILANLPADSQTPAALSRACRKHRLHLLMRPAYSCGQVVLGSGEGREALKKRLLHKKVVRRSLATLQGKAAVTLSQLKIWEQVRTALPQFCETHGARFQATGRVSSLTRPERRMFAEELAKLLCESGWFNLTRLMWGDRPIAWNYGFQFAGGWFWYQPTFDGSLEQYSPGVCLLSKVVAEACDAPEMKIVDLGLGTEAYKARFAGSSRQTLHLTMGTSLHHHIHDVARYRAAQMVKASPRLERGIRSALASFQALRTRKSGLSDPKPAAFLR